MKQDSHNAGHDLRNYGIYADREWTLNWKRNGHGNCLLKSIKALRHFGADLCNIEEYAISSRTPLSVLRDGLRKLSDDLQIFFTSETPYPFDTTTWEWLWLITGYRHCLRQTEQTFLYLADSSLVIEDKEVLKKKLLQLAEDLALTRDCLLNVEEPFVPQPPGQVSIPAEELPKNCTIYDFIAYAKEVQARQAASRAELTIQRSKQRGTPGATGNSSTLGVPGGGTFIAAADGKGGTYFGGGGQGGQQKSLCATGGAGGGVSGGYASGLTLRVGGYPSSGQGGSAREQLARELGQEGTRRYNAAIKAAAVSIGDASWQVGIDEAHRDILALTLPTSA